MAVRNSTSTLSSSRWKDTSRIAPSSPQEYLKVDALVDGRATTNYDVGTHSCKRNKSASASPLSRLGPAAYCYPGLKWPPLCSKYCFGGFSRWPLCVIYGHSDRCCAEVVSMMTLGVDSHIISAPPIVGELSGEIEKACTKLRKKLAKDEAAKNCSSLIIVDVIFITYDLTNDGH